LPLQARRLPLVIGTVMLLAVVAASLVPPPEEAKNDGASGEDRTETVEPAPTSPADPGAVDVKFDAVRSKDRPGRAERRQSSAQTSKTQTVQLEERVTVTVTVPKPGRVELEGLGLLQTTTPGTPALFDLFTDRAGRFAVLYTPAEGDDRVVGTLVVGPVRTGRAG
jgi:hypothetical protein